MENNKNNNDDKSLISQVELTKEELNETNIQLRERITQLKKEKTESILTILKLHILLKTAFLEGLNYKRDITNLDTTELWKNSKTQKKIKKIM